MLRPELQLTDNNNPSWSRLRRYAHGGCRVVDNEEMSAEAAAKWLAVGGQDLCGGRQVQLQPLVAAEKNIVEIAHIHHLPLRLGRDDGRHILGRIDQGRGRVSVIKNGNREALIQGRIVHHKGVRVHEEVHQYLWNLLEYM